MESTQEQQDDAHEGEEEEEVVEEMTEADVICMLDSELDQHSRCVRVLLKEEAVADLRGVTPAALTSLRHSGIAVLDGVVGTAEAADALADVCASACAEGLARPSGREGNDAAVRGDKVVWLTKEGDPARPTSAGQDHPGRIDITNVGATAAMLEWLDSDVDALAGLSARERQLAVYAPGERGYERHRDALPSSGPREEPSLEDGGVGTQRCLTTILYCVGENWSGKGGRLRAWLSPVALGGLPASGLLGADLPGLQVIDVSSDPLKRGFGDDGAHVVITPRRGRLVMFLAGAIDHRVEPCEGAERVAMSTWYH